MASRPDKWTFTEEQRDAVCKGEFCPYCQSKNIKVAGYVYALLELNVAYDCQECGEEWEGY